MVRLLTALMLFHAFAAHAVTPTEQPVETAGPVAIIVFLVLFFGSIGVYVWFTLHKAKKAKADEQAIDAKGAKQA